MDTPRDVLSLKTCMTVLRMTTKGWAVAREGSVLHPAPGQKGAATAQFPG